jgi:hypothetical protein
MTSGFLQYPSNDVSFQTFLLSQDGESYVVVEVHVGIRSYIDAVTVFPRRIYFPSNGIYFY